METHIPFFTVQDDIFCIGDPIALYRSGKCMDVKMMAGNTGSEFPNTIEVRDEDALKVEALRLFGAKADEFLALPEMHERNESGYGSVSGIECTVRGVLEDRAKNGKGGYVYCFDPDIPGWDNPGTFHSSDLWFWFETLAKCWRPFIGRHYDLARQMCDYFCNFVKTLDPNGKDLNGEDLPKWDVYSGENPCVMRFTGNGAVPEQKELSPLKEFCKERIMERMRRISII